ncbi:MAG: Asp-tRNA(Asn)/Glu-tRNA(Gln) amidotransferase subunit GatB [Myxococcota bacterium]
MTRPVAVVGLELHVQLITSRKLFTPVEVGSVDLKQVGPNCIISSYCFGIPGELPVLQPEAVDAGLRLALALEAEISPRSVFIRKHYTYPDLPKGYQITQEPPLALNGTLRWEGGEVRVQRVHLEEDAGRHKLEEGRVLVDYNRAGVPLAEVVTAPELSSGAEAAGAYRGLHTLAVTLGLNEGRMEEGELRCDANVSIRDSSTGFAGPRCELKNLNSFRFVEDAVSAEIDRQLDLHRRAVAFRAETRGWDRKARKTFALRAKETALEYRFLPEPDLPALRVGSSRLRRLRAELPELPEQRVARWRALSMPKETARTLARLPVWARLVDEVGAGSPVVILEAARLFKSVGLGLAQRVPEVGSKLSLRPEDIRSLCRMRADNQITAAIQATVLERLAMQKDSLSELLAELQPIQDPEELGRLIRIVVARHPDTWTEFSNGKVKLESFFVGQVMGLSHGRASPQEVKRFIREQAQASTSFERTDEGITPSKP